MVTPRSGSMDIDLSTVYLEIANNSRKCLLTYNSSVFQSSVSTSGVFGTSVYDLGPDRFGVIVIEDADSSISSSNPVLNRGDMVMISVNVSACFWGIEERADIWGTLIPEEGAYASFSFRSPSSLSDTIYDLL